MTEVRLATHADHADIREFDTFRHVNNSAIESGQCRVAVRDDAIAGYVVLNRSFFCQPFVSYLVVHPDHRRCGVASALLAHAESWCPGPKLWVSTGQDNERMQAVLAKLGYTPAGSIAELWEHPELFYYKQVGNG